jgi:transposase InsO family protein
MASHQYTYQMVREKLMPQLRRCRDRDVRVKAELILTALKLQNVDLACKRLGFSRSFHYKWWNRLVADKFRLRSLREESRKPKRSPKQVDGYVETRIGFYHRKGYGADMIKEYLRREGLPSASRSTINHVLNERKPAVKKRRFKLKKHRRRYELAIPGQRLQLDVKYSPMLVGGKTVYVYVAVDECTRWRFAYAYEELNEQWTVDFLDRLIAACPFPVSTIQTDNGWEFTFALNPHEAREHLMDTWCKQKGIRHRLIPPGVKELNGKVERSHRIDADYFYGRAPTGTLALFNRALTQWLGFYNVHRPHGGLGYQTPMEKLRERISALKTEILAEALEPLRQRFLKDGPKLVMTQTEQQLLAFNLGVALPDLGKAS